jgi:indole-3-acetate monooxygenase
VTPDLLHTTGGEPATILAALDALLPEVADRAGDGERLRTLPPEGVARLESAGLFRMQRVAALGGLELDPVTCVEVIERLAHADASTAWTVLIGSTANAVLGWLEPTTARAMIEQNPDAASSCVLAPGGRAQPDAVSGYRVTGSWGFNSGILHAAWRQVGVIAQAGTAPEMRIAIVPAAEGTVHDTWESMGLRGSGSHQLSLDDVPVPVERTVGLGDPPRHAGPYARIPLFSHVRLGVLGFPLGIARRALEEFAALARTKTRGTGARWSVAADGHVQAELGRIEGELAAARSFADAAARELAQAAAVGEVPVAVRARLALATQHAMRTGVSVVDTIFRHAGGSAVFTTSPLQRCFRDIHTAASHVYFSAEVDQRLARLQRLGFDEPTTTL